jgi:hypothetical protein
LNNDAIYKEAADMAASLALVAAGRCAGIPSKRRRVGQGIREGEPNHRLPIKPNRFDGASVHHLVDGYSRGGQDRGVLAALAGFFHADRLFP